MAERRTIVVTGGSSGIGLAAAAAFARGGAEVVLLGRDPGRLRHAVEVVRAAGGRTPAAYRADFAVLDEVRAVGARVAAAHERIDVLVNNAGQLAPARVLTADGYDPGVQINHLGGFLLSHLLLDRLRAAAPARIVTTGSIAEAWGTLDVRRPGRRQFSRWAAYGAGKQANLLFTVEAARRWGPYGIVPTCFFPGLIRSRFGGRSPLFSLGKLVFRGPEQGADTLLWLADDPAAAVPGGYFAWRRPLGATRRAVDPVRARLLWEASLAAVYGAEADRSPRGEG
ncbi:SDR family oxidoreductase [Amorphoplanes nipponensis]|uniref:Short-chain dehydrogenase n=1 Tax=Actinoplanes nipponensis TaxID=135950 RepID=A0A919JQ64_9ACTN|nr:SDR family NAD(P)-dependent oxidoreductase [Actinoplanes nipponensis]GIE53310.1 short-chain dehydrogenase [Actinoplanes nipponensis]